MTHFACGAEVLLVSIVAWLWRTLTPRGYVD